MDRLGAGLEQLDHRGIEADGDGAGHLDDEAGTGRGPAPRLAGPIAVPRAVHPEMSSQLQTVVEPDQEILADCLDARDRGADDPRDLRPVDPRPRRGHGPTHQMRREADGRPMEGIALGHRDSAKPGVRRPAGRDAPRRDVRRPIRRRPQDQTAIAGHEPGRDEHLAER